MGITLTLFMLSMLTSAFYIQPVKASGTIYIRADGSIEPPTAPIQRNGDLYTLTGNINTDADGIIVQRNNIILDGAGYLVQGTHPSPGVWRGVGIDLSGRINVTIKNIEIKSFVDGIGIGLGGFSCRVHNSRLTDNYYTIRVINSWDNTISENNLVNNVGGISLADFSYNNSIIGNNITENKYGGGITLVYSFNNVIYGNNITNTTGSGISLASASGNNVSCNRIMANGGTGIALGGSSDNTLYGNGIIANNGSGIWLSGFSSNNTIVKNNIADQRDNGIWLSKSSNNTVVRNNITRSGGWGMFLYDDSSYNMVSGNNIAEHNYSGIRLYRSSNNKFYHNNFINNTEQASLDESYNNIWDDDYPSGGNYWSDYTGVDSNFDGIGDTKYVIDSNNIDNYPLMGLFSDFTATPENHVQTICNSIISSFQFNGTAVIFNVSGEDGTTGFCRICIPKALMNSPFTVLVDGMPIPYTLLPCSNSTHSYLYFTYVHSTYEIVITSEIPPPTYTLTITTTVGGTTNPATGAYSYTANSVVHVLGIPNANYLFDHWELDSVNVGSANPYTVIMDKDHTLKAVFSPISPPPPKPVGGYSFQIEGYTTANPLTPYITLIAILTIGFITIRRKTTRKTK